MIPAVAVAAGAIAQWVSGIGFSLVCAPILIAVLGPREGVRVALVLSSVLNVGLLVGRHEHVLVRQGSMLLIPAVLITPVVAAISRSVDGTLLTVAAGVLTIVSAAALAAGLRWQRATHPSAAVAAGALSGTMNVIGSIGGPALALYTVNAGWPAANMRSTLQAIFLVSNVVALAFLGLPDPSHLAGPAVGLAAGWMVGRALEPRVSHDLGRRLTLGIAAAGGLAAIVRAVL